MGLESQAIEGLDQVLGQRGAEPTHLTQDRMVELELGRVEGLTTEVRHQLLGESTVVGGRLKAFLTPPP